MLFVWSVGEDVRLLKFLAPRSFLQAENVMVLFSEEPVSHIAYSYRVFMPLGRPLKYEDRLVVITAPAL